VVPGRKRQKEEISAENLRFILDFIRTSGGNQINIIGGEPTLHSEFKRRYDEIDSRGFFAMIFSNGVMEQDTAVYLGGRKSLTSMILNIREPQEYTRSDWDKIIFALKHIKNTVLSFRIYRLGFSIDFIFDLIKEFKLIPFVNLAPALPCLNVESKYLPLSHYQEMGAKLARLSMKSRKFAISWYSDSGFILCGFSKKNLKELKRNVNFVPNVNCSSAVEVKPNLDVQRCFGMWGKRNEHPISLREFVGVKQIHNYFDRRSLMIKHRYGALDECRKCSDFARQICGGGCLVHIFKKHPDLYHGKIFS